MMPFEEILKALGQKMELNLKPDANQSCRLDFETGLSISLELDSHAENIVMGSHLGEINPGPYRERIFKQALMQGALSRPYQGILAYSERTHALILFRFFPLLAASAEELHIAMQLFSAHALKWISALKQGEIPSFEEYVTPTRSGFLGL